MEATTKGTIKGNALFPHEMAGSQSRALRDHSLFVKAHREAGYPKCFKWSRQTGRIMDKESIRESLAELSKTPESRSLGRQLRELRARRKEISRLR